MKQISLPLLILCSLIAGAQHSFSFQDILGSSPLLRSVADKKQHYHLQIIYTEISRNNTGKATFKNHRFNVDSSLYFYCASLVKLPVSILALEKLNDLHIPRNTIMFTDSANTCQHPVKKDTTSLNGYPSVEQYIKKMCLVSDNVAYGRVYEFVGTDYIHKRLNTLGFPGIRIVHRFDGGCKGSENTTTNPVSFYNTDLSLLYHQPQQVSSTTYKHPLGVAQVGHAYYNAQGKKVIGPKDFSAMNFIALEDIHELLRRLIFPENIDPAKQYHITSDDRAFLMRYLSMYPRESDHPGYDTKNYYDSYKKYFLYGDSKKPIADTSIRITNIVGQSYGFMIDCAYITDKSKGIEFMLSAVIYANEDGIINDGKYEYNSLALPFLAELGRQIYAYELKRKR